MPELPEVQTTVDGLNAEVKGLKITDVWTDYKSHFHIGKNNIKNPRYFSEFQKHVIRTTLVGAEREGKNILMHLDNGKTMLVHMKMTGHFLYGAYKKTKGVWKPVTKDSPLLDLYNRFIHLVFSLSNGQHLAFSDLRKFGKVFIFETSSRKTIEDLMHLGPDPLQKNFSYANFKDALMKRASGRIKQVLMDQSVLAGIGNIYSDEMLFAAHIHPLSRVVAIPDVILKKLFHEMKIVLKNGIDFGGDSDSDYRNIYGKRGTFQERHSVYRKTGTACITDDGGKIERLVIGGRSAHFCPKHQQRIQKTDSHMRVRSWAICLLLTTFA